jgi:hypothetical protein
MRCVIACKGHANKRHPLCPDGSTPAHHLLPSRHYTFPCGLGWVQVPEGSHTWGFNKCDWRFDFHAGEGTREDICGRQAISFVILKAWQWRDILLTLYLQHFISRIKLSIIWAVKCYCVSHKKIRHPQIWNTISRRKLLHLYILGFLS